MTTGGRLRRRPALAMALVVALCSVAAFHVVDRADAGQNRCARHAHDSVERAAEVTGTGEQVLVIGDSWSVGLGLTDLAASWPARLEGRVRVAGFSGSGFSEGASPCEQASFAQRAAAALAPGASLVVVEGGLNDHNQTETSIERGFHQLMTILAENRVVVVGPATAPRRAGAVPRVDALLADLSADYGVPYVATSVLDLAYLPDRLHLTPEGHVAFGDHVAEQIALATPARPRHEVG